MQQWGSSLAPNPYPLSPHHPYTISFHSIPYDTMPFHCVGAPHSRDMGSCVFELNPEYWEYMHKHMHLLTLLTYLYLEWEAFDGNFVHTYIFPWQKCQCLPPFNCGSEVNKEIVLSRSSKYIAFRFTD